MIKALTISSIIFGLMFSGAFSQSNFLVPAFAHPDAINSEEIDDGIDIRAVNGNDDPSWWKDGKNPAMHRVCITKLEHAGHDHWQDELPICSEPMIWQQSRCCRPPIDETITTHLTAFGGIGECSPVAAFKFEGEIQVKFFDGSKFKFPQKFTSWKTVDTFTSTVDIEGGNPIDRPNVGLKGYFLQFTHIKSPPKISYGDAELFEKFCGETDEVIDKIRTLLIKDAQSSSGQDFVPPEDDAPPKDDDKKVGTVIDMNPIPGNYRYLSWIASEKLTHLKNCGSECGYSGDVLYNVDSKIRSVLDGTPFPYSLYLVTAKNTANIPVANLHAALAWDEFNINGLSNDDGELIIVGPQEQFTDMIISPTISNSVQEALSKFEFDKTNLVVNVEQIDEDSLFPAISLKTNQQDYDAEEQVIITAESNMMQDSKLFSLSVLDPENKPLLIKTLQMDKGKQFLEFTLPKDTKPGIYSVILSTTLDDEPYSKLIDFGVVGEIAKTTETVLPNWIKNNAGWWATGQIDDDSFSSGIEFMIKEGIIKVPQTKTQVSESEIPDWVRNNAGWWAEDTISDNEFVAGLEHLIKIGVISR